MIDGDDRVGGNHRRALHHVQPDAAAAEHGDRLADLHLRQVVDQSQGGGHSAAHQGGDLEGNVRGDRRERGSPRRPSTRLKVVTQPELTVRPFQRYLAGRAWMPAPLRQWSTTWSPGFTLRHAGADLDHHAAPFVAQQMGQETVRALGAGNLVELRAADAAAVDLAPAPARTPAAATRSPSSTSGALSVPEWRHGISLAAPVR